MMRHLQSIFKRILAIAVAVCFAFSDTALTMPITKTLSRPAPSKLSLEPILEDPTRLHIPFDYATLKEIHHGTNGKLIIHIQDAHVNLSGQLSLAGGLDYFLNRYDIPLVLVEGGDRDVTLTEVKSLSDRKNWKIVAKRFLYDGMISGDEYLNLTSQHKMRLQGVEFAGLYQKNLEAYAALVDKRKDILQYLHTLQVSLDRLKNQFYPKDLLDYETVKAANADSQGTFKETLKELFRLAGQAGISLQREFAALARLRELGRDEDALDFDAANRDQAKLLEALTRKGAAMEVQYFTESSRRIQNEQNAQYLFLNQLLQLARDREIVLKPYPDLLKYRAYLKKFAELQIFTLFEEMELLEDAVYEKLLAESDHFKVRAIDRYLGLLKKAYRIQMSSREFAMYQANEPNFGTVSWQAFMNEKLKELDFYEDIVPYRPYLEEAKEALRDFYSIVGERDTAFLKNTDRVMAENGEKAAFLIAGGYHTENLTRLLRNEGYSYVVLSPIVYHETDFDKYEHLLLAPIREAKRAQMMEAKKKLVQSDKEPSGDSSTLNLVKLATPGGAARLQESTGRYQKTLSGRFVLSRLVALLAQLAASRSPNQKDGDTNEVIQNPVLSTGTRINEDRERHPLTHQSLMEHADEDIVLAGNDLKELSNEEARDLAVYLGEIRSDAQPDMYNDVRMHRRLNDLLTGDNAQIIARIKHVIKKHSEDEHRVLGFADADQEIREPGIGRISISKELLSRARDPFVEDYAVVKVILKEILIHEFQHLNYPLLDEFGIIVLTSYYFDGAWVKITNAAEGDLVTSSAAIYHYPVGKYFRTVAHSLISLSEGLTADHIREGFNETKPYGVNFEEYVRAVTDPKYEGKAVVQISNEPPIVTKKHNPAIDGVGTRISTETGIVTGTRLPDYDLVDRSLVINPEDPVWGTEHENLSKDEARFLVEFLEAIHGEAGSGVLDDTRMHARLDKILTGDEDQVLGNIQASIQKHDEGKTGAVGLADTGSEIEQAGTGKISISSRLLDHSRYGPDQWQELARVWLKETLIHEFQHLNYPNASEFDVILLTSAYFKGLWVKIPRTAEDASADHSVVVYRFDVLGKVRTIAKTVPSRSRGLDRRSLGNVFSLNEPADVKFGNYVEAMTRPNVEGKVVRRVPKDDRGDAEGDSQGGGNSQSGTQTGTRNPHGTQDLPVTVYGVRFPKFVAAGGSARHFQRNPEGIRRLARTHPDTPVAIQVPKNPDHALLVKADADGARLMGPDRDIEVVFSRHHMLSGESGAASPTPLGRGRRDETPRLAGIRVTLTELDAPTVQSMTFAWSQGVRARSGSRVDTDLPVGYVIDIEPTLQKLNPGTRAKYVKVLQRFMESYSQFDPRSAFRFLGAEGTGLPAEPLPKGVKRAWIVPFDTQNIPRDASVHFYNLGDGGIFYDLISAVINLSTIARLPDPERSGVEPDVRSRIERMMRSLTGNRMLNITGEDIEILHTLDLRKAERYRELAIQALEVGDYQVYLEMMFKAIASVAWAA